jgi:hypothetical protein
LQLVSKSTNLTFRNVPAPLFKAFCTKKQCNDIFPIAGERSRSDNSRSDRSSSVFGSSSLSVDNVHNVHGKVAAVVKEMQGALQAELHDEQFQLFRKLGQGAFGTVYHGALLPSPQQSSDSLTCSL